jgi:hypothetical protein
MTNCTLSVRARSETKSPTAHPDKYETKNNQPCRREGAGKTSSESYSLKIIRSMPSGRLRGPAGTLWSGSPQADHSFAGRQNL